MTKNEQNKNPNDEQNAGDGKHDEQNEDSKSEELKPLTDEEMADMSTEEITAHAEKLEEQVKASKKQTPDQIRENQIKRAKKAQEKAFSDNEDDPNTAPSSDKGDDTKSEIAQADILTLSRDTEFEIGSEEQKILQWYVDNGKVATYKEALGHAAVKAELAEIESVDKATSVIDENDSDEVKLRTKKEAIANARATGEIPEDQQIRDAMVEDNLDNMSSLK